MEAGDLGSHLYNAWLAQLVERGQVHGLWVARQWTNVLFEFLLSGLGNFFGLRAAEKIAVSLAVLIFFWGVFALAGAAARRAPWFLVPLIAVFAYGWTFELGFFNYYISLGLSFFSLALFWRGEGWERLAAFALAPLILLAHPLGLAWLVGAAAYIGIAERVPRRYHPLLLAAAAGGIFFAHHYLWHHFVVEAQETPFYQFNGTDQMILFGARYKIPQAALLFLGITWIAIDLIRRRREHRSWVDYSLPLQLYILVGLGVLLLPEGIRLPHYPAALALLTERLTSVSAALVCCLLGAIEPRKWHWIGMAAIGCLFFTFLYQDTAIVNKMEEQVEHLVATLPPGQRVMATILPLADSRLLIHHIVDRACIGHCFSYGNYEPSAGEFRLHALPGNPYVMTDYESVAAMEEGEYTVQEEDLPAYQIYQCSLAGTDLCIRPLQADEDNDRLGVHPKE